MTDNAISDAGKVVCALACRVQSARLYGKPLQLLSVEKNLTILDYMLDHLAAIPEIDETVLAISEGEENTPFKEIAKKHGLQYVVGDQKDVLGRLIAAGKKGGAAVVFRVTSECPFIYGEGVKKALDRHIKNKADLTIIEGLPEGSYFELINLSALEKSHKDGEDRHRSEMCSLYINENQDVFAVQKIPIEDISSQKLHRPDVRITVDWPEDLIVVRELYKALKKEGRFISIAEIIDYLDTHTTLKNLNGWIDAGTGRIWD